MNGKLKYVTEAKEQIVLIATRKAEGKVKTTLCLSVTLLVNTGLFAYSLRMCL
jgi:hypothetical protein